jgi:hypothetical protein
VRSSPLTPRRTVAFILANSKILDKSTYVIPRPDALSPLPTALPVWPPVSIRDDMSIPSPAILATRGRAMQTSS